jgi:hypothetical protein
VNLILVVGFIGYAQLPRSFSGKPLIQSVSRSLVASPPVRDLSLCAKHLFFAAMTASVLAEALRMSNESALAMRSPHRTYFLWWKLPADRSDVVIGLSSSGARHWRQ